MIQRRGKRKRPSPLERLEQRSVPTTLVALIDTGVDETSSGASDSPYYDFTYAYDAENKQTAAQYGNGVVSDNSGLTHGHGSTVADFIVQGISNTSGQQGASAASVKIMPIRDTFTSGQYTGQLDPNAIIRGIYWAADHGAAVINLSFESTQELSLQDSSDPHNGTTLGASIAYAQSKGAIVVNSIGNQPINVDGSPATPAYPAFDSDYTYSGAKLANRRRSRPEIRMSTEQSRVSMA